MATKRKNVPREDDIGRRVSPRIQAQQEAEKERLNKKRIEQQEAQARKTETTTGGGGESIPEEVTVHEPIPDEVTVQKKSPSRNVKKTIAKKEDAKTQRAEEKKRLVRKRVELLNHESGSSKNGVTSDSGGGGVENGDGKCRNKTRSSPKVSKRQKSGKDEVNGFQSDNPATDSASISAHLKVKETLRLFNKHYLHFSQEADNQCRSAKADKEATKGTKAKATKGSKSKAKAKKKKASPTKKKVKTNANRPDLKVITKMKQANEVLYPEKMIGHLPGIDVGHQFYSRAEMCVLGFHSHWLNGIDLIGKGQSKTIKNGASYKYPLAVAIVISGMYEDDLDNSDEVVYTGQGGHNLTGDKRQSKDQKLDRGNLALKNCVEQQVPVRVVRGHKCKGSYTKKIYTYDGLYAVDKYWAEKGISGFTVYKYRLKRLEGQPMLTTNQVNFVNKSVPKSLSEIRGLVCDDITGGLENIPIPATNLVDDPPVAPTGFTYCKYLVLGPKMKFPSDVVGCNCIGECQDPKICACAKLNGSNFPYVDRNGGRLIEAKDVVYECGPRCGCGPKCVNRTSQELKYRLEVYKTPKKGWAVRSWDFIPSGAPVCEYRGVLMRTEDVENASENYYLFDIDCVQTMKGLDGREKRHCAVSVPTTDAAADNLKADTGPEFCIDACTTGNVARFINHSCEPNLFVQCVVSSHHDLKLARVMLFAADNIPPLQELTYDYGYALDSVVGPDGKVKQMACYCGAAVCRKRLL